MKSAPEIIIAKLRSYLPDDGLNFNVTVPEPQFGDYATNAALVAAKVLGRPPLEVAAELVDKLEQDKELAEVFSNIEAVRPGFINFRLSGKYLNHQLSGINEHPETCGASKLGNRQLVLVEYFQLNVAKPPYVQHIIGGVLGDSLKRIFISQGYRVVSDTHIGDWGTQFGILLWAYKKLDGKNRVADNPLEDLNNLYVEANGLIESKPEIRDEAKVEFVRLEEGDKTNRDLWEFFVSVSKKEFNRMLEELNLLPFEYDLGESYYEDLMPEALRRLEAKKLLLTGETGERYVDLEEWGLGRMICIKSDGGTTYGLRDLAAMIFRYEQLPQKEKAELVQNIYAIDNRQSHHMAQVFKASELIGLDTAKSVHVEYGFMKLPEGAFSTRKGNTIKLELLLDEAKNRALAIINEKNPGLANKDSVAEAVGLGAIKYANLSHNRKSEVIFTWESALSFEGNTGPYLQYSHARLRSILRKSNVRSFTGDFEVGEMDSPEKDLLRKLIHFPEITSQAAREYAPNLLANYLYEVAGSVNSFYQAAPVLNEEDLAVRSYRLAIVAAAATVLKNGLYLLGMEAPEEM